MPLKKNRTACKNTYLVACGGPQSVDGIGITACLAPDRRARRARPQQITTEKGGQAHKHRYSNLSPMRKKTTLTLSRTASTNTR